MASILYQLMNQFFWLNFRPYFKTITSGQNFYWICWHFWITYRARFLGHIQGHSCGKIFFVKCQTIPWTNILGKISGPNLWWILNQFFGTYIFQKSLKFFLFRFGLIFFNYIQPWLVSAYPILDYAGVGWS